MIYPAVSCLMLSFSVLSYVSLRYPVLCYSIHSTIFSYPILLSSHILSHLIQCYPPTLSCIVVCYPAVSYPTLCHATLGEDDNKHTSMLSFPITWHPTWCYIVISCYFPPCPIPYIMQPLDGQRDDTNTPQRTRIWAETIWLGSRRKPRTSRGGSSAGGWVFADGPSALLKGDGGTKLQR